MTPATPIMHKVVLVAARACAKAHGVELKTISWRCHGDSRFLSQLTRGECSMTIPKFDADMAWLADPVNWPGGKVSRKVVDLFAKLKSGAKS